jgi:hypothetical protein
MAKWLDRMTEDEGRRLKALYQAIRRIKPEGWSVVWKINELSIRPIDRLIGRFSLTYSERRAFSVMFHSRALGIWNKSRRFGDELNVAGKIVRWMVEAAGDPTTEDKDDLGT